MNNYSGKYLKLFLFVLCFIIALLAGGVRYLTGPEWALSLFYLFPIFVVVWSVGKWAGVIISIISALSWLAADLMMMSAFSNPLVPYLNETFRLMVFLIITFILSELKNRLKIQQELARTDPLTGIANRRAFLELAALEINRISRFKRSFSVAYIDLDNFKTVNDRHGHAAGDILLTKVAKTIKKNIRAIDTVARLGGDEFIILLTETNSKSAFSVVHKLQKELLAIMEKNGWPVTFSIGVATFDKPPSGIDVILKEADGLMYAAKQTGKNKIVAS